MQSIVICRRSDAQLPISFAPVNASAFRSHSAFHLYFASNYFSRNSDLQNASVQAIIRFQFAEFLVFPHLQSVCFLITRCLSWGGGIPPRSWPWSSNFNRLKYWFPHFLFPKFPWVCKVPTPWARFGCWDWFWCFQYFWSFVARTYPSKSGFHSVCRFRCWKFKPWAHRVPSNRLEPSSPSPFWACSIRWLNPRFPGSC